MHKNNLGFKNGQLYINGYHEWEECHNEWKSHMKKFIEMVHFAILTIILYRITLIFLKSWRVLMVLHASTKS
jgi:hypothetical protein